MSKFSVGKEVLSYCSKCKLNLAHIIVAMKDLDNIAKVECRTCKALHAFKDPSVKAKKVRRTTGPKSQRKMVSVGELWVEEMAKIKMTPVPYGIRSTFSKGDLIEHKSFANIFYELVCYFFQLFIQA